MRPLHFDGQITAEAPMILCHVECHLSCSLNVVLTSITVSVFDGVMNSWISVVSEQDEIPVFVTGWIYFSYFISKLFPWLCRVMALSDSF